jgi:hypothetical protein
MFANTKQEKLSLIKSKVEEGMKNRTSLIFRDSLLREGLAIMDDMMSKVEKNEHIIKYALERLPSGALTQLAEIKFAGRGFTEDKMTGISQLIVGDIMKQMANAQDVLAQVCKIITMIVSHSYTKEYVNAESGQFENVRFHNDVVRALQEAHVRERVAAALLVSESSAMQQ